MHDGGLLLACALALALGPPAFSQDGPPPTTGGRPGHQEPAREHDGSEPPEIGTPPLPEGMTLDDVLDHAGAPPPPSYPDPIRDDAVYVFALFEQLEYRFPDGGVPDHLGWEAQGWVGRDFDKLWWKNEAEAVFEGGGEGESETDILYSRLIAPFWSLQAGARYANDWTSGQYSDTWSGVLALQGLAPYKFELDSSLYVSQHGDVSFELEAEYDLRITQRLVAQPRAELGLYAQDIPGRNIGAGLSEVSLGLRLRYEIRRELAPYAGIRYWFLVGETDSRAGTAGEDTRQLLLLAGLRFAF